jgi:hypothetical protein
MPKKPGNVEKDSLWNIDFVHKTDLTQSIRYQATGADYAVAAKRAADALAKEYDNAVDFEIRQIIYAGAAITKDVPV